jgi:O-antigen/teichoic acid export membrane protein
MEIFKYFGDLLSHKRTLVVKKNLIQSAILKIFSLLSEFYLISLILTYIGSLKFGIILIMFSFLNWFVILDFGVGNSLRNKIAENLAKKKNLLIRKLISTGYAMFIIISIIFLIFFLSINPFLSWTRILSTKEILASEIYFIPLIFFIGFAISFVIKMLNPILLAFQKSALRDMPEVFGKISVLFLILILIKKNIDPSITVVSLIYVFVPILVTLVFSIYVFFYKLKIYKPSIALVDFTIPKKIFKNSLNFFILQISMIIMMSTDYIIISQLYGPEKVTTYHIAGKYYSLLLVFFIMITTPMWSSYTDAFLKKDFTWIKKVIKSQEIIFCLMIFICIMMFVVSDFIFSIWVGDLIFISTLLSISWITFVIIRSYNMIYSNFLNGINLLKVQVIVAIFISFLNVPLSIFLAKYVGMGPPGVILATAFSFLIDTCFKKIQYNKIISNKAKMIWKK